jgi:uncharacterized protein (TIGR00730 family)
VVPSSRGKDCVGAAFYTSSVALQWLAQAFQQAGGRPLPSIELVQRPDPGVPEARELAMLAALSDGSPQSAMVEDDALIPGRLTGPPRAYEDAAFLHSLDARTLRVLAELLQPQHHLRAHGISDTVVFFGSSRAPGPSPTHAPGMLREGLGAHYDAARELSRRLTRWSAEGPLGRRFMVCSGGGPGIMEAVARGATDAGGESIGFGIEIPGEPLNEYVTPDLAFMFHYFFMRKFWFVYNAKAFVFFPGGFGTIDELSEVLTLVQTGKLHKKVGIVLYDGAFWRSVINFEAMVDHGVISPADLDLIRVAEDVEDAERQVQNFLMQNYGPTLLRDAW